jgi:hypothetical protein
MNPTVQTSHGTQIAALAILFAGILVLYCIRNRLIAQLLFLIVLAGATLTIISGLNEKSTILSVVGVLAALASVAGFAWSYHRRKTAAV